MIEESKYGLGNLEEKNKLRKDALGLSLKVEQFIDLFLWKFYLFLQLIQYNFVTELTSMVVVQDELAVPIREVDDREG